MAKTAANAYKKSHCSLIFCVFFDRTTYRIGCDARLTNDENGINKMQPWLYNFLVECAMQNRNSMECAPLCDSVSCSFKQPLRFVNTYRSLFSSYVHIRIGFRCSSPRPDSCTIVQCIAMQWNEML